MRTKRTGGVLYEHPNYHPRRPDPAWNPTPCVTGVYGPEPKYRLYEGAIVSGSDTVGRFTISVGDDEIVASRALIERVLEAMVRMEDERLSQSVLTEATARL